MNYQATHIGRIIKVFLQVFLHPKTHCHSKRQTNLSSYSVYGPPKNLNNVITTKHSSFSKDFQYPLANRTAASWVRNDETVCLHGQSKTWLSSRETIRVSSSVIKNTIKLQLSHTKVPSNIQSTVLIRRQRFDKRINLPRFGSIDVRFIKENELLFHLRVVPLDKL